MTGNYQAIVIGSGHNGLANAAFLARAGLKTLVVEKNDYIGGATVSLETYREDWIYSNCSYVASLLRPEVFRSLRLDCYGLQIVPYGGGVTISRDGDYIGRYVDPDVSRREVARHSLRDAHATARFDRDVMRQARFIRQFLLRTPPDPTSFRPRDLLELLYTARAALGLGEDLLYDTLRFYTMSIADFLAEYFEHPLVAASHAGSGIIGSAMGVMSPGTAYVLLHHAMGDVDGHMGAWGFARGGMGAVSKAMHDCFTDLGGATVTGNGVARILVERGRAVGVVLENGDEYRADVVVSGLTLPRTFLDCMDPDDLDPAFLRRVRQFKIRGSSGKLNIALDAPPRFTALPEGSELARGDMHLNDSIERLERAYDDWKAGTWSRDPYVDLLIPSMTDPTMTPPGKHFMSVFVQYVPGRGRGLDRRAGRGLRPHGRGPDRGVRARVQGPHPAHGDPHTARAGTRRGPDLRQHFPRRADAGPAQLQPAAARPRPVPRPAQGALPVRFIDPPRRRRHGRAGRQRRARDPRRPAPDQHGAGGLAG